MMAAVAQLVEPSVVVRVVAGSNPVGRPIFSRPSLSLGEISVPDGISALNYAAIHVLTMQTCNESAGT